ncbi:hypothetical protein [Enterobacter ludwigii]|uniref:hypothetical protein n=1 Tax=Enterobacter ludwigii TaxID=299767 RepID=UPI003F6FAC76
MRKHSAWRDGCRLVSLAVGLMPVWACAVTDTLLAQKTSPVSVMFGVRALAPETPVNSQVAFVSQDVALPEVVCSSCDEKQTHWESTWIASGLTAVQAESHPDNGWYVFASGLKGVGVSVKTSVTGRDSPTTHGDGARLSSSGSLTVGLVRLAQDTGAGLAALPPAQFKRLTAFYDATGRELYIQEDTVQVSADLTVPTCTSTTDSLSFELPDMSQVWLERNVQAGSYTDTLASSPQLVVANCSANTQNLRIRFIPSGTVSDSVDGTETILVGRDEISGADTGVGYLLKYDARGFGQHTTGVVQWNRQSPLTLGNPVPGKGGGELTEGITVTLQAFWARAKNGQPVTAGNVVAKGMYQVSYD